MAKPSKPHPWLSMATCFGMYEFEASVEDGATEYIVRFYSSEEAIENGEPVCSVSVAREDFLAMMEIARANREPAHG
jgi:hypothetical protein